MTIWHMLAEAQAAQSERLAEEQRVIDSLPREYRVPPRNACGCFAGHCRGGAVNGRLPTGLVCKDAAC